MIFSLSMTHLYIFFLEASFEVYKIWVCSMSYLSIIIIIIANFGAALKIRSAQISPIQNGRGAVGVPQPSAHVFVTPSS